MRRLGMSVLTPKQESFAQQVAEGKTYSDAYRYAYDAKGMKDNTINSKAYLLMAKDYIRARVEELRKPVVEETRVTLKRHLDDLLKLRNMAAKSEQWAAAIQAEKIRGKASGLHIDKLDATVDGNLTVEIVRFSDE